jgi:SNF family Na+-dependent transporter
LTVAEQRNREQWGSRIGVILAVAGSAVGLGNFLRFPGTAAQNGGGAFMLPYFVSLLVLGIPMCWAEWTMGRYAGARGCNSAPAIFTVIWRHPLAKYFGGLALVIPLVIYMYYVLIESWCLGYAFTYLTGSAQLAENPSAFFGKFVGIEENGIIYEEGSGHGTWLLLIVFVVNFMLIYRGVSKGIEQFCKVAMPLMLVLGIITLVRVLTLGTPDPAKPDQNVLGGLGFMWNPKPEALLNPATWLAASGQIFFSLSVGFGIIINYASYLTKKDDVALSGLTSCSMNEFFEVCMGGLITLPAAFIFLGLGATAFTGSSFSLGFQALPSVFARMPAGQMFGALWFFMLFLAAITSSISMLQPVIAFLEEGFGLKRHASVTILGVLSALGCGFVLYFSKGLVALDTFDFWVGSVLILVLALVQALLYGWGFGMRRGHQEIHQGAHIRVPWLVQVMLKWVIPVYLLAIFTGFCFINLPSHDTLKFTAAGVEAGRFAEGEVPDALRGHFASHDLTIPAQATIRQRGGEGDWRLLDRDRNVLFVVRPVASGLEVYAHETGYVEKIGSNPVVFASLGFVIAILAFLLLMVHIAGRRWEAQGRFDNLSAE